MFEGRQTVVADIPEMIHLLQRNGKRMLPKADFDRYQEWTREIKNCRVELSLWRYVNEEK